MNRTTFIAGVAAAAIGLTTLAAMANTRGPDFSTLDTDGNGEITLLEMQSSAQTRFGEVDTDGDGFLTQAELAAHAQSNAADRAERMISRRDANDDGKLSLEEMAGRRDPGRFFNRMDADNSGGISEAELEEARAKMRGKRGHKNRDKN